MSAFEIAVADRSRASLALQLSLFRLQKTEIRRALAGTSRAFQRYEARYHRATQDFEREISREALDLELHQADVVMVGDYHTLRLAQASYVDLVRSALKSGRRVVIALEFVEGRHQRHVDRYLKGASTDREFLDAIGHPYRAAFDVWPGFKPIFELAKDKQLEVRAIDLRATGASSLERRDEYAARRIAEAARGKDRPLVMVLIGQYHVAPAHLPRRLQGKLPRARQLLLFQNAEGVYWRLARQGRIGEVEVVKIDDRCRCLVNTSPVVCQQSFLDYVEAESGDAPLDERRATQTFKRLARLIAGALDADVEKALEEVLVFTPGGLGRLSESLEQRGDFEQRELAEIRRYVLERESAYVPGARLAYLASLSLNHAAEEAAHFVRHVCVGPAMDAPRTYEEAFWARCLEEALGFVGSRLVNPARRCTRIEAWKHLFQSGEPGAKKIAAYVLALTATEVHGPKAARPMLPLGDVTLFHAVSHALGYLLGDALWRAYQAGRLHRSELQALFQDPFKHAAERYFALRARLDTRLPEAKPTRRARRRSAA